MPELILFGGTFNPIHNGHLSACSKVLAQRPNATLLLMPTASPPHKTVAELASGKDRLRMCQLAVQADSRIMVDDYEVRQGGVSYTIDTLRALHRRDPAAKLFLLVGTDMFLTFTQWREWAEIGGIATLLVSSRMEQDLPALRQQQARLARLGVASELMENSVVIAASSEIRDQLHTMGYSDNVPPPALNYLLENNLYTDHSPYATAPGGQPLRDAVRKLMSEKRYRHSLAVQKAAVQLAVQYGADPRKAAVAGILHDVCKEMPTADLLQMVEESGIICDIIFTKQPALLHSYAGAQYLQRHFGVTDQEIIRAVRYHTTARAGMTLIEELLYLADLISEDRDYPDVEQMRALCRKSVSTAMAWALAYTVDDLIARGQTVCRDTRAAYEQYLRFYTKPE